jgi:hypothetical protein
VSASLSCTAFGFLGDFEHIQTESSDIPAGILDASGRPDVDVQRFDVKDTLETAFQLESLILAQNERWRQA